MSRMTNEECAKEREFDKANSIENIEGLLIEIRDLLEKLNNKF